MAHIDLERLVCAGAIDLQFRELLLKDSLLAATGYYGEHFRLTSEEKELIASIKTTSFEQFVETVANWIQHKRALPLTTSCIRPSLQTVAS